MFVRDKIKYLVDEDSFEVEDGPLPVVRMKTSCQVMQLLH